MKVVYGPTSLVDKNGNQIKQKNLHRMTDSWRSVYNLYSYFLLSVNWENWLPWQQFKLEIDNRKQE